MNFKRPLHLSVSIMALILAGCGGGGSSNSTPTSPSLADNTNPTISVSSSTFTVESGETFAVTVTATDNVGVTTGPEVSCTNGGIFAGNVFTAPTVATETQSVCNVTASDAAGNTATESFTATIQAPDRTPPTVSVSPSTFTVASGETQSINITATDDRAVTTGPDTSCDNGELSAGGLFIAPNSLYDASATCTVTATDAAGNSGTATISISIKAPVEVTLSKARVFESSLFSLRKTTPPGDIEVTQLSGPDAILAAPFSATSDLYRAPSLDFDGTEQLSFEVKVTGPSNETATTIINAPEVIGRSGPGIPVAIYEPALSLEREAVRSFNTNVSTGPNILATRQGSDSFTSDQSEIVMFGGEIDSYRSVDYENSTRYLVDGVFDDINFLSIHGLASTLSSFGGITILSKSDDRLTWLRQEALDNGADLTYIESDSFSIEDPCFFTGRRSTGQNFIWVGQENNGFSVVELEPTPKDTRPVTGFDDRILQNIGGDRSLCYIFPTDLPRSIKFPDGSYRSTNFDDLITIDYKANEMVLFADPQDDRSYEEVGVIPLQTNTDETLRIVDVFAYGGPSTLPRSLVVLLTNDREDGVHRLINIIQDGDDDDNIRQTTYAFSGGIPVALVEGNFGGNDTSDIGATEDIVVITNSNQSLFFESNTPDIAPPRFSRTRSYAQPVTFETLPGAGSAVTVNQRNSPSFIDIEDILVSYPETGELRIYTPDPTLPKVQPPE